jgi:hypothetical protein
MIVSKRENWRNLWISIGEITSNIKNMKGAKGKFLTSRRTSDFWSSKSRQTE